MPRNVAPPSVLRVAPNVRSQEMSGDDGTVASHQPAPDPSVEWWTTSDVAAYLGLQVETVSSYRLRGQMPEPDLVLGRTHVWHPSTIMVWHRDRPRPGVGERPTGRENADACGGEDGTNDLTPDRAAALLRQGCAAVGLDPAGHACCGLARMRSFQPELAGQRAGVGGVGGARAGRSGWA